MDRSTKLKTNCALLNVTWGSETLEKVSKVSGLSEWLLERWVKAGVKIMLLGLSLAPGKDRQLFHVLAGELAAPSLTIAPPQCFKELVSEEAMVLSTGPKEKFTASTLLYSSLSKCILFRA